MCLPWAAQAYVIASYLTVTPNEGLRFVAVESEQQRDFRGRALSLR